MTSLLRTSRCCNGSWMLQKMTASGSAETEVHYELHVKTQFLLMCMNVLAAFAADDYLETEVKAGAFTLKLRCHATQCFAQSVSSQHVHKFANLVMLCARSGSQQRSHLRLLKETVCSSGIKVQCCLFITNALAFQGLCPCTILSLVRALQSECSDWLPVELSLH